MFSTSQDVLLLTVAVCVAALTIFSCWGLFYIVGVFRHAFKIVKDVRRILEKAEGVVDVLKDKINSSASYLLLMGEALKKILEIARSWHERHGKEEPEEDEEDCEKPKKDRVKEK